MSDPVARVILWLALVNGVGFVLMGIDKWKARRGAWRISERALFLPALLGGTLGVIAGMRVFRHKTKHGKFKYGLPILLAFQLGVVAWLLYQS